MNILFAYKGRYHVRTANTLEYLSAIAKSRGFQTGLAYDPDLFGTTDNVIASPLLNRLFRANERTMRAVREFSPDMLVFVEDCNPDTWNARTAFAAKTINPAVTTVVISMVDRDELRSSFDHVLIGEPEFIFAQFLDTGSGGASRTSHLRSTELADINALPLPDKMLFARYVNFSDSYMIFAGKGCPFRCTYCEETIGARYFGDGYYRVRKPEYVIEELAWARKRLGIREVIFKDSVLTWDKAWLNRFLSLYTRAVGVPYKCFVKAEGFDDKTVRMLKETGCYCVEYGVQTFNEVIKQDVLGRKEKNETLFRSFAACDKAGLRYDVDHLFGLPGETLEDHRHAAEVYAGLKLLNRVKCFNLVYYPAADICKYRPACETREKQIHEDFFSHIAGSAAMIPVNAAFQKLFKVLPLLGRWTIKAIVNGSGWKTFLLIPSPVIIMLQMLLAMKNRDLRFGVYARHFLLRLKNLMPAASPGASLP